jgi:plasmid stability protein
MEHHENVTDDKLTLTIDAALAERLHARAEAAGQSVEEYALDILRRAVEELGFEENEAQWTGTPVPAPHDNGVGEDVDAYADELDRICDETLRTGGIPWEQFRERLLTLGKPR